LVTDYEPGPLVGGIAGIADTLGLYQFLAHRPHGCLGTIGHADLSQDVLDVFLDRLVADVQRLGDFLVGQAVGQLPQDFAFALR